jgi:peptidoglycan/xylan/chitin deacetylase (PgdA/CDA1 family)
MTIRSRQRVKELLGRLADVTGIYARNFRSKMVIVTFHRVNDWMAEDPITCGTDRFEEFCLFFKRHFRVVPLSEQIAGCRAAQDMGGTLSITFDDGYRDNFEVAAPLLERLGLPAAFFVATGFIGTDYTPPWDRHLTRQAGWMDWDQVRALRKMGFEVGAHTDRHVDLATLDSAAVRAELVECRETLQRELAERVTLFAYPFGGREHMSEESRRIVQEVGFECCLGAYGGTNPPSTDPFRLNRVTIGGWFATPNQLGIEIVMRRA